MHCPYCAHADTQVMETRLSEDGHSIRRRRRCEHCDKRFTTYERAELALPSVVKHDGSREDFDRRKVLASMQLALRKRPVSQDLVEEAVERIQERLINLGVREVRSEKVGELVMRELKKLDKIAYVRFASVYRNFEDVDEFAEAILEVRPKGTKRSGR